MTNKTYKNHKLLLFTELIFCNNTKANGKILLGFCWGKQGDAIFWVGLQKYIITAAVDCLYISSNAWELKE